MTARPSNLAGWLVLATVGLGPALAEARTPLPTIEVVAPKKRLRLLDVRGSIQVGAGYSLLRRSPVLALDFEDQFSFFEITKTTHVHASIGMNALVDVPARLGHATGIFGVDAGLGLTRYAPGGPAFVATVSAGPRWQNTARAGEPPNGSHHRLVPQGWGVVGRADLYPFYRTIPELVANDYGWFREYVLSGLHVWVAARYDVTITGRAPSYMGGVGMDFGRTLFLPVISALVKNK